MISLKALIKIEYFFNNILFICLIIFLFYCKEYPFTINSNQLYKIIIPLLLLFLLKPKILSWIINKKKSEHIVALTDQQHKKINEIAQKQNKSVEQFCLEAINEKLEKSI